MLEPAGEEWWFVDPKRDLLYRKLDPGHWDPTARQAFPEAFQDPGKPYTRLSFYVARVVDSPAAVFRLFGRFGAVKKACGVSSPPSPAQMCDAGYGMAELPANVIKALGLEVETIDGRQINERGHINVIRGQEYAILLYAEARVLERHEIIGR